jgi:hypothetical protein
VTQNINSTTFQPFVLYSAAAVLYVSRAFRHRPSVRAIREGRLSTPPYRPHRPLAVTGRRAAAST